MGCNVIITHPCVFYIQHHEGNIQGIYKAVHAWLHGPWPGERKLLKAFSLASLPANQERAAVAGWNMLRLQIGADNTASVWLGFGRIVASKIEAAVILANLV
jgi:hypothetical protein